MSDYYGTVHFLTSIPCWNILYQGVKHFKRGYETFWTVIFGGMKHIQNSMKIGGKKHSRCFYFRGTKHLVLLPKKGV